MGSEIFGGLVVPWILIIFNHCVEICTYVLVVFICCVLSIEIFSVFK